MNKELNKKTAECFKYQLHYNAVRSKVCTKPVF